jgi:predicted DCC family thiol-disulfide oxidoreductase YuxK
MSSLLQPHLAAGPIVVAAEPARAEVVVEAYYDGACPFCVREVAFLRRLDRRGRIRFTDIAAEDFDAAAVGVPYDALMARIHARLPDGSLVTGVEVFRRLYAAVGFGPVAALTRLPGVSHLLDAGYAWFARNRLRLGGRCDDGGCARPGPGPGAAR